MNVESMSNDQILGTFFGVFNWLYQIEIPLAYRQQIEQHIRAGWFNNDPSEHQLLRFVLEIQDRLSKVWCPDDHRATLQQHFANEFAMLSAVPADQLNDKYRILSVIHRVVESLRPGVTRQPIAPNPDEVQARQHLIELTRSNLMQMRSDMIRQLGKNLE
jgi:hypothetical protein